MNANGVDLSGLLGSSGGQGQATQGGAVQGSEAQGNAIDVASLVLDVTDATFEQVMQLSATVPIVVDLWAEWCGPCKTLGPILESVTESFGGQVILAKVDVDQNPGLAGAFKAQSIPTVAALIAGQAVPMFQGAIPEAQVRQYFQQLIELARQHGVTGVARTAAEPEEEQSEPIVNPAHEKALEALENGDFKTAISEYERVITNSPKDEEAKAALAQAKLLDRLSDVQIQEVRDAAAANPDDIPAQLLVADLDLSGGHIEDAFLRILELFARVSDDDKNTVREHLLELFDVVGHDDKRVTAARVKLANLLF